MYRDLTLKSTEKKNKKTKGTTFTKSVFVKVVPFGNFGRLINKCEISVHNRDFISLQQNFYFQNFRIIYVRHGLTRFTYFMDFPAWYIDV